MTLSIIALILAIACRSVAELSNHGKLRWSDPDKPYGFCGVSQYLRKYELRIVGHTVIKHPVQAPKNWYYKFIKSRYKERWFTSTNLTVAFTDSYHLFQSLFFIFLSLSFSLATGLNFFLIWLGVLFVHFICCRTLQR